MRPGGHLWPAGPICWGIHGMPGWLEPPCAMHRKVCHATGSSLPTGAAPPAGQSRKCCFCEKAFPFCPTARQTSPIIAGKDYNDWKTPSKRQMYRVAPFFTGRLPAQKIKANPVKIIFSLSGTDGCLFIRRSHFCKKNRKINFSTKRRRSVSLCAFPFPAAFWRCRIVGQPHQIINTDVVKQRQLISTFTG